MRCSAWASRPSRWWPSACIPSARDPLLQFTVPEALAVIERASVNLRGFLVSIAFRSATASRSRSSCGSIAGAARCSWPRRATTCGASCGCSIRSAAATQELRERFTRQIYEAGREHLARRLARAFVKEVGRAAIDLYGGNLRVTAEQLRGHVTAASRADLAAAEAREAEPIRILVAGQTGAGKSSLVNALANAVEAAVDAAAGDRRASPPTG